MCNLYKIDTNQRAILEVARADRDLFGSLPADFSVYPDYRAPIVRLGHDGHRELAGARWGLPTPPKFLEGKKADPGVTNLRSMASPHWRRWLGVECRRVVPMTSFSEYETVAGKKRLWWFALDESKPLGAREMEFDCGGYTDGTSGGPFLGRVNAGTGDGTVIGVIGGVGLSQFISVHNGWPVLVPTVWIFISVFGSAFVGIISGFYPAWKAAQLDPIDALRYE